MELDCLMIHFKQGSLANFSINKKYFEASHNYKDRRKRTYKAPEYFVGSGATIDLFILLISACIS